MGKNGRNPKRAFGLNGQQGTKPKGFMGKQMKTANAGAAIFSCGV